MKQLSSERSRFLLQLDNRSESNWHLAFSNFEEFDWKCSEFGGYAKKYFLYDTQNYFLKKYKNAISGAYLN